MKKTLLLFLMAFLCAYTALAQTPPFHSIQTPVQGVSSNAFPLGSTTSNRCQYLYQPNYFGSGGVQTSPIMPLGTPAYMGLIDTLWLRVNTATASTTFTNFKVSIGQTVGTGTSYSPTGGVSIQLNATTVPVQRFILQTPLTTTPPTTGTSVMGIEAGTAAIGRINFTYSTGCEGSPRVPVIAVVNPSSGDLALATSTNALSLPGNDSLNDMHPDGASINYFNPTCQLIATVVDTAGGNALGQVTSKVTVDPTVSTWNGQPYARRWYDINVASNGPALVTLYYTQADFNDYNASPSVVNNSFDSLPTGPTSPTANIRITQISGGGLGVGTVTGVHTPVTVWNATASRWEMTFSVAGFSQFFLHAAGVLGNTPLSVVLTNFTVVKNASVSDASWNTMSESNNSHFNVQRSFDGNAFTSIGKVTTKAPNGTSSSKLSYAFTDDAPQIGHNYYRLEQVDQDGNLSYSQIIDLVWGADGSVVSIYPNPATDKLNIDLSIDRATQMEVRLLDISGRVVKSIMQQTVKGMNSMSLNLSDVASGLYGVQIYDNNSLIHSTKVTKQHK